MRLHRHFRRFMQMPFGRDLDQHARDLADAVLELGLARLPAAAAQSIQFDIGVVGAVARQQFDVLDRQEQFCFGGIVQLEAIMVIENAERFGLAQLHQLRGRIGRGSEASTCLLLYREPLGEMSKARLKVIRETTDGFRIAEEDLKLRGEGELLGTRQSGTPGFQVARIEAHADLLEAARDDARLVLSRDPELQSERGEALRLLLYLFGRDEAVRLLRAG